MANSKTGTGTRHVQASNSAMIAQTDDDLPEITKQMVDITSALTTLQENINYHADRIKTICVPALEEVGCDETQVDSALGRQLQSMKINIQQMNSQLEKLTKSLAI